MRPILQPALAAWGGLPTRAPGHFARQERRPQEAVELSSAGTERRRQRPKNQAKQAVPYRGKQKPQRDKNVGVGTAKTKRVGSVSQTDAGNMPDKKSVASDPLRSPLGTLLDKDPGLQGYDPTVPQPHHPKKSRARARSPVGKSATLARGRASGAAWRRPWREGNAPGS